MKVDLIIKNGLIIDGTGNPGFYGDIAVDSGQITAVASRLELDAVKCVDAKNCLVIPGLIDPHVHEELVVLNNGSFDDFLQQGVTTIINGNCGHSITPFSADNIYQYMYKNGLISAQAKEQYSDVHPHWDNFSGYVEIVKNKGFNLNLGLLLGHGTIRWSVMGGSKDRPPTPAEEAKIKQLIVEGMEEGALGLSTGLSYIPSRYADTEELIKAAKVVADYDGVYASHIRYYLGEQAAVREAIEIGQQAGARVQVSHLTPTAPEAFREILKAREKGLEVAVDTIPKSSGHCTRKDRMLQFIMALSTDLFELGIEGVKAALKTAEGRKKVLEQTVIFGEDRGKIILINCSNPHLENRTIGAIAEERDKEPDDLLLDLLADDHTELTFWLGGINRKDFPGEQYPDLVAFNPVVMAGSDRIFGEPDDPYAWYELFRRGTFPLFFKMLTEKGVRLEEVVRRVTSFPAQQFRLADRGLLRPGLAADIAVIDWANYRYPDNEEIDYRNPLTRTEGVRYVVVNGQLVLDDGLVRNLGAGQFISRNGRVL